VTLSFLDIELRSQELDQSEKSRALQYAQILQLKSNNLPNTSSNIVEIVHVTIVFSGDWQRCQIDIRKKITRAMICIHYMP
jgi:hypothetical protein